MTAQSSDDQPARPAEAAAATDAGAAEADRFFRLLRQKTEAFVASGFREGHARRLADLELRIARWPSAWGDDLVVLIYGDFSAPPTELDFPDLGITIEPEQVTTSDIRTAMCVLKARVKIPEKSVKALVDAAARISTLLGALAVLNWGNCGFGWWSHLTHGPDGGVMPKLEPDRVKNVVEALRKLPLPVARKLQSALYWIREPRQLLMEGYRSDALRVYAGYWNAFECLVEAVCLLRPQPTLGKAEKQAGIDAFVAVRKGKLDAAAISECYKQFVDAGFVAKASHALRVCFPERADQYIVECFRMKPEQDRLYNIRNAINHGDVDADDPNELLRVEDRHSRLWMIVFGMLGLIIPIDRPRDER
ncbi:MAG TPA: hypothetical protein VGK32_17050 [Vicinamibacterales bacterium]|jgi:hypothetical protein